MDRTNIQPGQLVKLNSAAGIVERVVVEDLGAVVCICRPEEYAAAQRDHRKPVTIGFRKADIVPASPTGV